MKSVALFLALASLMPLIDSVSSLPTEPMIMSRCDAQHNTSLPAANAFLPSPFKFLAGVSPSPGFGEWNSNLWDCRRQEIGEMFQEYELGWLPGPPDHLLASLENNNLTITCSVNSTDITFVVPITYPSGGSPPYPAMLVLEYPTLPIPEGIAVMNLNTTDIAWQTDATSRGKGKFYDLFGADASAGAMIAWTWAVSRVFDALEQLQQNSTDTRIDIGHIGTTGCSRWGKGALVAGAFEHRLALVIPQESGSGTLAEIVDENVWFSNELEQFVNNTNLLPFDHHMLIGMVAPRALLAIDNFGVEWLSPNSQYGCEVAGRLVYQALGVADHMGYSQAAAHTHCAFPDDQTPVVNAFIDRFLRGNNNTDTNVTDTASGAFNQSRWINWDVPTIPR
ncbi:hypothetical protein EHS25_001571 [Saitozyma podzolica]|uniref:(4-O-methyl)-D-glucuronate--lignin esterase n=1 Tax=Saitozyma podzolica TaxID=1890683 RepID=A0A427YGU3_9TREE|nr:hypothetical protein EHS25_001571 [Saitozyma podzolica]